MKKSSFIAPFSYILTPVNMLALYARQEERTGSNVLNVGLFVMKLASLRIVVSNPSQNAKLLYRA